MVGFWATALVHIPDGKGPQFLHWMSGTLPARGQIHLPPSPALGGTARDLDELTSLLLSTQIQWHA